MPKAKTANITTAQRIFGTFYPFEAATSEADFDLDEVGRLLELSVVQTELLRQFLRRISVVIWFTKSGDASDVFLELEAFWDDNHISGVALDLLLDLTFAERNQIGDKEEIAVLKQLRDKIDAAISIREQGPLDAI